VFVCRDAGCAVNRQVWLKAGASVELEVQGQDGCRRVVRLP